jgi:hypothetical protein
VAGNSTLSYPRFMSTKSLRWSVLATSLLLATVAAGCSSGSDGEVEALEARVAELESEVVLTEPVVTVPPTTQTAITVPTPSDAGIDMMDAYCVGMFDGYAIAGDDPADPNTLRTVLETCLDLEPLPDWSVLEIHCHGIGMGATLRTGDSDVGGDLADGCAVVVTQDFDYVELLRQRADILGDDVDLFLELFLPAEG